MQHTLKDQLIWLTGASSGIGESLARRLAREGAHLALSARRADALERLVAEITAATPGARCRAFPLDVTDRSRVAATAGEIAVAFRRPIDILVANAGTYHPFDPTRFDSSEYEADMKLNYSGILYCVEAVLPEMLLRRSGYLVGMSSLSGYRGLPRAASYGASKAAVINFFEGMRFDLLKHGVDVSIINPGFVKTPLTDKNDFPMPFLIDGDDAAEAIVSGMRRRKKEIHFPAAFSWIMKIMRILPFPLYHAMVAAKVVRK